MRFTYSIVILTIWALAGCGSLSPKKDKVPEDSTVETERGIPVERIEDADIGLAPLSNLQSLIYQQGLRDWHTKGHTGQGLRIAILDNGFAGLSHSIGKRLPPDARLFEAPGNTMASTDHGTKLAEIVYAMATGKVEYDPSIQGPEILLFNTNGYTNLKAAITKVIEEKVDIVLYAQVWEYGGNFDGAGFINQEVNQAIASGVLWVNAAGNLGQATWNGKVEVQEDGSLKLPWRRYDASRHSYLRFTVPQDDTDVKIVLAWNDFTDDKEYLTPQDLDMELVDDKNQVIGSGELIQTGLAQQSTAYSAHAREIIHARLKAGSYKIRARAMSRNFDEQSMIRVTVNGLGVRMLEKTRIPTVLIPAENPQVLTVGATDVDYSGLTDDKPEIKLRSEVRFGPGENYQGTSSATAIAVGSLACYFSRDHSAPNRTLMVSKATIDTLLHTDTVNKSLSLPAP